MEPGENKMPIGERKLYDPRGLMNQLANQKLFDTSEIQGVDIARYDGDETIFIWLTDKKDPIFITVESDEFKRNMLSDPEFSKKILSNVAVSYNTFNAIKERNAERKDDYFTIFDSKFSRYHESGVGDFFRAMFGLVEPEEVVDLSEEPRSQEVVDLSEAPDTQEVVDFSEESRSQEGVDLFEESRLQEMVDSSEEPHSLKIGIPVDLSKGLEGVYISTDFDEIRDILTGVLSHLDRNRSAYLLPEEAHYLRALIKNIPFWEEIHDLKRLERYILDADTVPGYVIPIPRRRDGSGT